MSWPVERSSELVRRADSAARRSAAYTWTPSVRGRSAVTQAMASGAGRIETRRPAAARAARCTSAAGSSSSARARTSPTSRRVPTPCRVTGSAHRSASTRARSSGVRHAVSLTRTSARSSDSSPARNDVSVCGISSCQTWAAPSRVLARCGDTRIALAVCWTVLAVASRSADRTVTGTCRPDRSWCSDGSAAWARAARSASSWSSVRSCAWTAAQAALSSSSARSASIRVASVSGVGAVSSQACRDATRCASAPATWTVVASSSCCPICALLCNRHHRMAQSFDSRAGKQICGRRRRTLVSGCGRPTHACQWGRLSLRG